MSYQRITAELRDGIVRNALNQRFAAQKLAIATQGELIKKLEGERDQAGYEAAFSQKDRERMAALPEGWLPTASEVKVAVEETNEVIQIDFATPQRVPYEVMQASSKWHSQHIASIIPPDHPYMAARRAVIDAEQVLETMESQVAEGERSLRAKVKAVVESVSSVSRLVEQWPEVVELLPEVHAGPTGGLPAELLADLNAEIGLGKA